MSNLTSTAAAKFIKNGFNTSVSLVFRGFEYVSQSCTWHDDPRLEFCINDPRVKATLVNSDEGGSPKNKQVDYKTFQNFLRTSGIPTIREWDGNMGGTTIG
jgi:hypothetical protein